MKTIFGVVVLASLLAAGCSKGDADTSATPAATPTAQGTGTGAGSKKAVTGMAPQFNPAADPSAVMGSKAK